MKTLVDSLEINLHLPLSPNSVLAFLPSDARQNNQHVPSTYVEEERAWFFAGRRDARR